MTLPISADKIPCVEWHPFGLEKAFEILGEVRAPMVYDMSGRVSELVSEECWHQSDMYAEYSQIGMVEIVNTPVRLENGLCKAEYSEMMLEDGEWIFISSRRLHAIALDTGSSCEDLGIEDFISLEKPVEDSFALLLLQRSQDIYNEYLSTEERARQGLELRYIGLHTTWELNTYFALGFSDLACYTEVLLVRSNETRGLEYVSYYSIMC